VHVAVEEVTLVEQGADSATVKVTVTAADEVNGVQQEAQYEITWQLIDKDGAWKLDRARVQAQ
jgi:hypothetical protein